jgi:hypothetical protein
MCRGDHAVEGIPMTLYPRVRRLLVHRSLETQARDFGVRLIRSLAHCRTLCSPIHGEPHRRRGSPSNSPSRMWTDGFVHVLTVHLACVPQTLQNLNDFLNNCVASPVVSEISEYVVSRPQMVMRVVTCQISRDIQSFCVITSLDMPQKCSRCCLHPS